MKIKIVLLFMLIANISVLYAQKIAVLFNHNVDYSIATNTNALWSVHLEDTICKLINNAQNTIDLAVWDNGSTQIVTALNNAHSRGVSVRYISSSNSTNTALNGLNESINLLNRDATITSHVMHNKFVIIDKSTVLTGSMNFGIGSMEDDFNNIIILNDTNLALNYTIEFNEMWGDTGLVPDLNNSKFGPDKTDNTVHTFNIGSTLVQSYFSPSDHTTTQIVNAINSADFSLDIAMFTFINNDIGDAVVAAKARGVMVRCIIENISYLGSEYNALVSSGISVISHENIPFDFHHKYCIIDAFNPNSDPIVITGSHNWTNSAEDDYDENTLIIHSDTIANLYSQEFSKRYSDASNLDEIFQDLTFCMSPNPNNGSFTIKTDKTNDSEFLEIYDVLGQQIFRIKGNFFNQSVQLNIAPGLYFVRFKQAIHKLVIK